MMGSEPWMLDESTRWFVKRILAVMPSTAGAVAASWTATASGLAGGMGPSLPAVAIAVPPPTTPTVPTITASRRRLDMLRKEVTPTTVDRAFEETLTTSKASGAEADRLAERQPPDTAADVLRSPSKRLLDLLSPLAEVLPALVVDRDDGLRAKGPDELDRVGRCHRVAQRPGDGKPDAAQMQERGTD